MFVIDYYVIGFVSEFYCFSFVIIVNGFFLLMVFRNC